jgi:hypothetical protein
VSIAELMTIKSILVWMRNTDRTVNEVVFYAAARSQEFPTFKKGTHTLASRAAVLEWYELKYLPYAKERKAKNIAKASERMRSWNNSTTAAPVAKNITTCDVSEIAAEIRNLAGAWRGETSSDIAELKARMDRIEQSFVAMRIPIRDIEGGANG